MPGGIYLCNPRPICCTKKEQGLFLASDPHLGSAQTNYELLESELKQAFRRNDRILLNGDIFDNNLPGMKKHNPSSLHKDLQGCNDPMNRCMEMAEKIFLPFVKNIDLIGEGNHDARSEKVLGYNPVTALVERLNSKSGSSIAYGGYCGLLNYAITLNDDLTTNYVIYYHHGYGGGSGLSASLRDFEDLMQIEDVDLFWLGHRHSKLNAHIRRFSPSLVTGLSLREVRFVRTGSYQDEFASITAQDFAERGSGSSYVLEKGLPPCGLGGVRVIFRNPTGLKLSISVEH